MHILILLLALTSLAACRSENKILGRPYVAPTAEKEEKNVETNKKLQVSTKPFQVVAFEKGQSVLRSKLMSQLINQHLTIKAEVISEVVIKMNDELTLTNKSQVLTDYEQKEYFEKSTQAARVIVAFNDHLEVYFVPAGLVQGQLSELLSLKAEQNNKLILINETKELTSTGKAYYFVSTNKKELLDFDKVYFTRTEEYSTFSNSLHLKLNKNQKVQGTLSYNYYVENSVLKEFTASRVRCLNNNCGPCRYTREVPGASWIPLANASTEHIGLSISANGMIYPLSVFGINANGDNQLNLNFKDVISSDVKTYDLVISLINRPVQKKMDVQFLGYQCGEDRDLYSEIAIFKTKADARLVLTISGHGDLLNDMTL